MNNKREVVLPELEWGQGLSVDDQLDQRSQQLLSALTKISQLEQQLDKRFDQLSDMATRLGLEEERSERMEQQILEQGKEIERLKRVEGVRGVHRKGQAAEDELKVVMRALELAADYIDAGTSYFINKARQESAR